MPKSTAPKTHSPKPKRISLPWLMIVLVIAVGIISFIYADGIAVLYQTWYNFTLPGIKLEVRPQTTIIPTSHPTPIYIDAQLKNRQGQLLDGRDIIPTIISGEADISLADSPPTNVSQRLWLRAPEKPQLVTLNFSYKHLNERLAIEVYDPTPPAMPIIKTPVVGTSFTTATPAVSGETNDNNAVEIYVDSILNSTFKATENKFSGSLQIALKRGKHKITAATINKYGVRSAFTPAVNIDIQTPDPEIDLANLLIKPNPAKVGGTFQIFVPISSNTSAVQLIINGTTYPLQDSNNSSVYSGIIPSPSNSGLYRLSLMITTTGGETVLAEKVASIQIN